MSRQDSIHWVAIAVAAVLAGAAPGCRAETPVTTPAFTPVQEVATIAPTARKSVFHSKLAGRWYTGNPDQLREEIRGYLAGVEAEPLEKLHALVLPHAGYRYSGQTACHGIRQLEGKHFSRVIVIGPTHRLPMRNVASLPTATHYATPLGEVPLDTQAIATLMQHEFFQHIPQAHADEHSVQIEVPLLQAGVGDFTLIPIVVGQLDESTTARMAQALLDVVDAETLVVASTDFTHYGPNYSYIPFSEDVPENIRKLDMAAYEPIRAKDSSAFRSFCKETGATICGREAVAVLLAMLPPKDEVQLLKYDTSGRIVDDFSNSVSYLCIAFTGAWPEQTTRVPTTSYVPLTPEDREHLLRLARATLDFFYEQGRPPSVEETGITLTPAMRSVSGAFVTLTRDGHLRGCIGDIYPTRPLYEAVMSNALMAARRDPRFRPVERAEWPELELEISALSPPHPVASHKDIVIGKHGIVLSKDERRAVYLPQVAPEQNWSLEETLSHLSLKARLPADAWREGARFAVFEANVFGEEDGEERSDGVMQ